MSETESMPLTAGWWRWPLVPIAAPLGATLGAFLLVAFQWLSMKLQGGMSEDGWFFLYILPIIQSVLFGYLYTQIACAVAPRAKVITGIVMVTLLGVLSLWVLISVWSVDPLKHGRAVLSSIQVVATMIAAIVSLINFREENGWT